MRGVETFNEIVLYGSRGHSQAILSSFEDIWQGRVKLRAVIDDLENGFEHPLLGVPVMSGADRLANFADVPVLLSMGDGGVRKKIAQRLADEGAVLATVIDRTASRVPVDLRLGHGSHVPPYVRFGPYCRIGMGVQLLANAVAHNVTVGDFSTLGYGSLVLGHVCIGSGVTIAPGAILRNGKPERPLTIGDGAVIGVGAVVVRDVPAGAHVIGNPAMPVTAWGRLGSLLTRR